MSAELMITADGSHTVHLPELNVTYHSRHGALQESMHIFIKAGLHEVMKGQKEITLFEMGFGTGLNALLTMAEAAKHGLNIQYHSIEAFPLENDLVTKLNFEKLEIGHFEPFLLQKMHEIPFGKAISFGPHFTLTKYNGLLQDFEPTTLFDLVYFDAFAPDIQPELWTEAIFVKMKQMMKQGACLLTYSSKGSVRRAMKAAGLTVSKLKGPPGKWEMVRAYY